MHCEATTQARRWWPTQFLAKTRSKSRSEASRIHPYDATFISTTYSGKDRDTEFGLDYFPVRYFNSYVGRFMSPDYQDPNDDVDIPLAVPNGALTNPQALNLYSYVRNNPGGITWEQITR